jgi:hypothetical protein
LKNRLREWSYADFYYQLDGIFCFFAVRCLLFDRGEWKNGSPLPDYLDDECFDAWRVRTGFNKSFSLSDNSYYDEMAIIYDNEVTGTYLAEICLDGCNINMVYLPDYPSMMMFIKDYSPAILAIEASSKINDINNILGKLFYAYHGHYSTSTCYSCDPMEMARNESMRRKREEKNNKA